MVKMRVALQRLADNTSFEKDVVCDGSSEAVQAYVDSLNENRMEGVSEVKLIAAWQVGEAEEVAEVHETAKAEEPIPPEEKEEKEEE